MVSNLHITVHFFTGLDSYAYRFYVFARDGTRGFEPYKMCDGCSLSPIAASCLQVLHVARNGTRGLEPYMICNDCSLSRIATLCLQVLRVALDGT
jgi:hypothetical protein